MSQLDLLASLRGLEIEFHQPEVRRDPDRLDKLLHDYFEEIGRSGRLYDRATLLQELRRQAITQTIYSQDFKLAIIAEGIALLTYRSVSLDARGCMFRYTKRAFLWQHAARGWKLRYHQGTPTDAFVRQGTVPIQGASGGGSAA